VVDPFEGIDRADDHGGRGVDSPSQGLRADGGGIGLSVRASRDVSARNGSRLGGTRTLGVLTT
jgi:hypothetical protein